MNDWKSGFLKDIVVITMGQSPIGETCNNSGVGLPLLNGPTEFTNRYPIPVQYTVDGKKFCEPFDILFCVRGSTTGRMNWADQVYAIGRGIASLKHKKGIEFRYYLKGILDNNLGELLNSATGSTFPNVSRHQLENIQIDIPPLAEQKAIADVLSSLDDKIDLLQRQNKTLEQLAQTLFRQWFIEEAQDEWKDSPLGDFCVKITKGTTPTTLNKNFVETGINFIKVNCIDDNGNYLKEKFNYIDDETNELLNRSKLRKGDLLYSIAGTIGRIAVVDEDILPANVNQALAIIRVDHKKINPNYIKYCLLSKEITFNLHSKIVHAVQPNLSLGEISNTLIPKPTFDKLQEFSNLVDPIEEKIQNNRSQIRTLENLRYTLLPKLISGEVRVKV